MTSFCNQLNQFKQQTVKMIDGTRGISTQQIQGIAHTYTLEAEIRRDTQDNMKSSIYREIPHPCQNSKSLDASNRLH